MAQPSGSSNARVVPLPNNPARSAPPPLLPSDLGEPATLGALFEERAAKSPSSPFLIGADATGPVRLTYGECRTLALHTTERLTSKFCDASLPHCPPIAILAENGLDFILLLLAAWYAALPLVLVPITLPAEVSQALVRASGARALLYGSASAQLAAALHALCRDVLATVEDIATVAVRHEMAPLAPEREAALLSRMRSACTPRSVCAILSTSGSTTGTSVKAVPLTHANVLHSCRSRDAHWLPERLSGADSVLGWLPLAHVMGLVLDLINTAILHGGRYVLFHPQGRPLPVALLDAIGEHRPSFVSAVPWLLDAWRTQSLASPAVLAPLRTLRALQVGGAMLDEEVAEHFLSQGVRLIQSAGMTETAASLFTGVLLPADAPRDFATLRAAYPLRPHATLQYELALSAEEPEEEADETPGALMRGELVVVDMGSLAVGYLGAPEATARSFTTDADGVRRFRTGDTLAVRRSADSTQVFYAGRVDDTLSLATGEKLDAAAYEAELRSALRNSASPDATLPTLSLLGNQQPFPFLAAARGVIDDATLWRAVVQVNAARPAGCRVPREAVLRVAEEELPIGRKRQVIRALAHARLLPRMRDVAARLAAPSASASAAAPTAAATAIAHPSGVTLPALLAELADVLGIAVSSLAGQEHTNFAALGLTSLLAERLASRLHCAPHLLFMHPTLARLAAALVRTQPEPSLAATPLPLAPTDEPIAVIGLSCRAPGGVNSAAEFWNALIAGTDLIAMPLSDRFTDVANVLTADAGMPTHGGLLRTEEWLAFDRRFFGIGETEAGYMDPRQRLALELAWEALESAGVPPSSLSSSNTAVYAALSADHAGFEEWLHRRVPHPGDVSAYQSVGGAGAAVAGRVAFALGLRGPALIVDAACASSAVALSLARTHLLSSPTGSVAIVLATQLMLTPTAQLSLTRAGALSPTSHSAPFDASANGYVRSDGCAAVVLTRASAARQAGQHAWCELLGAALTHGGDTAASLTAPSPVAQENAIRGALAQAQVRTEQVSYVESHGTGTRLGDPMEAEVLARVYARVATDSTPPLIVGALKGALGHTEAASGLMSLVKLSLCAKHSLIPRNLRFSSLTPLVSDVATKNLAFPKQPTPWPAAQDGTRFAALSNFGFTGTHGHLVFACPADHSDSTQSLSTPVPLVLPIAARSEQSVRAQAKRWLEYLGTLPSWSACARACHTAALRREHFDAPPPHGAQPVWRVCITLTPAALKDGTQLAALASSVAPSVLEPAVLAKRPRVAMSLAGQGLALPKGGLRALCAQLSALSGAFASHIARCEHAYSAYVRSEPNCPLPLELLAATVATDEPGDGATTQPPSQAALVSFEVSLAALWHSWGVAPSFLIGHSLGEIAAAAISGALSVEEAVRLVATRECAFVRAANADGTMAAILADRVTAEQLVAQVTAHFAAKGASWVIGLTGYNGPTHHVAAGTHEAIDYLIALPVQVKRVLLPVARPFHSPLLAPAAREWAATHRLADVATADSTPPKTAVISTATGALVAPAALRTMQHWERHAASPVLFEAGLLAAASEADVVVLCVAPAPSFASMTRRALPSAAAKARCVDSLDTPADSAFAALLTAVGRLFTLGVRVEWAAIYADLARVAGLARGARLAVDPWLPTYAWQRDAVRLPGRSPAPYAPSADSTPPVVATHATHQWAVASDALVRLSEHVVHGEAILPAAAQLLALWQRAVHVASLQLVAPAPLGDVSKDGAAHLHIEETSGTERRLLWNARDVASVECALARKSALAETDAARAAADATAALGEAEAQCTETASVATFYTHLRHSQRLAYGPHFRAVESLRLSPDRRWVLSSVAGRDRECPDLALAIAQLDACFHTGAALLPASAAPHIPSRLADALLLRAVSGVQPAALLCVHEALNDKDDEANSTRSARLYVFDAATRQPLLAIGRYTVAPASLTAERRMLHRAAWAAVEIPKSPPHAFGAVLLSDGSELCDRLKQSLAQEGHPCTELRADLAANVKAALAEALRANATHQRIKIVYGWSLPSAADGDAGAVLLAKSAALLQVVQAAAEHSGPPLDVCVLTRGAVRLEDAPAATLGLPVESVAAATQAMVGVASAELRSDQLRLCAVDLRCERSADEARWLTRLLPALPSLEPSTLAVNSAGQYFAPRIEGSCRAAPSPAPLPAPAAPAGAVGLVTGGLGGVGRHLAAWLLTAAPPALRVSRVVLVGRTFPSDSTSLTHQLAELCDGRVLAATGDTIRLSLSCPVASLTEPPSHREVNVLLRACDVSDEAQLGALLCDTAPHVVVHSAGVLADRAIAWMSAADLRTSLGPKACAAWHLHRLLPPSAHLLLCSSVSAVLHTPGQANYAAANAFLDALATRQGDAGTGLRLSVGWGPWLGVGMAASFDAHAARSPCRPMRAHRALAALTLYVADALASPGVSRHILLADMPAAPAASAAPSATAAAAAAVEPERELIAALSAVLGRPEAELRLVAHDTPLHQHGLDSLAAMELRAVLTRRALPLPLRAVRAPTIGSLLGELRQLPPPAMPPAAAAQHAAVAPPPARASSVPASVPQSRWLLPVVGDPVAAKRRVVLFNDAGGDPANFKCWAGAWRAHDTAVLAVHWPGHTTRAAEGGCKTLSEASARFIADAMPLLGAGPYAFVGQCVGAYYAYRFAVAIAREAPLRPPSALVAIACPGPAHMGVLTQFTDAPPGALPTDAPAERLVRGLHALTLAIGFTEDDWQRLRGDPRLFAALVSDVSMTDVPADAEASPALACPVFALLGANDPVVKRAHLASWLERAASFTHRTLPALGHNIQYETPVVATVGEWVASAFAAQ